MSNSDKKAQEKEYTFKICGIDKEITLQLSGESKIEEILDQISEFCAIESSALLIRNGPEALSDLNKTLSEYTIEDPSNILVLRDVTYEENENENKESDLTDDSDVEQAIQLHSNDGSLDFVSIKSPMTYTVPPNSYRSTGNNSINSSLFKDGNTQIKGLYSALEAHLNGSNGNAKKLKSIQQTKKN